MQVTKYKPAEDKDKEPVKYLEEETLNSMIPIWKKAKSEIKDEEYNSFYKDTFYDYNDPMKVINTSVEGAVSYKAVLYIPSKAPFNYYMKSYEKGLKLYNGGIMIMEKCADLLPDCFSFVKGVVDSELSLNISRETIQQSYQLKKIAVNLEKKIQSELENMLNSEREKYENFFKEFGLQIKYGIYESFGSKKELIDLLMFRSLKENKPVTLKEYKQKMISDQKYIYYASGKSIDAVKALPQAENIIDSGADILCFSDDIDEFIVKILNEYDKRYGKRKGRKFNR
jgi:molecular chaperone HtpG